MSAQSRDELFARPPWGKVFVSSKMSGGALQAERAAAIKAIERFPHLHAWAWERNAAAGPYYSEEECVGHARTSDALVLILEDELTEVTRKEYNAARRRGAHCIVLLKAGVARSASLQRFVARARRRDSTANFGNLSELESQLFSALRTFSIRPAREKMLELRAERHVRERVYEELDLEWGTGPDDLKPISEHVSEARSWHEQGRTEDALVQLYELAEAALGAGLVTAADEVLNDVRAIIPDEAIDERWRAWLLNVDGRVRSAQGRHGQAQASYDRMRQLGRTLADRDIEATALQNLGVERVIADDWDGARQHFRDGARLMLDLEDFYGGLQILLNQVNVLSGLGHSRDAHHLLDDIGQLLGAVRNPGLRASVEGQRGLLLIQEDRPGEGRKHLLRSLRIARRAVLAGRELTALRNLAKLDADNGRLSQAAQWHRKAIALAESMDDRLQLEILRRGFALVLHEHGDARGAAEQFLAAAELAADLGDSYHEVESLGNAAACLADAGRRTEAKEIIEQVLESRAAVTDDWRAGQLWNLALVLIDAGDHKAAVDTLERAANLTSEWTDATMFLRHAAEVALMAPQLADRAPALLERELNMRRSNQVGVEWGWEAATMGALLSHRSQSSQARQFFTLALRPFASRGDHQRAFLIRNDRAIAAVESGDLQAGRADLNRSLQIAESLRDRALMLQARQNLGEVERRAGEPDVATGHLKEAQVMAAGLDDARSEADVLLLIALCHIDEHRLDEARQCVEAARDIGKRLHDHRIEGAASKHLGHIEYELQHFGRAGQRFRTAVRLLSDSPSRQLAEALGGAMLADANRGVADEEIVQALITVSQNLGWEAEASVEAMAASGLLLEHRNPADAAALAALGLVFGVASWAEDGDTDASFLEFVLALTRAADTRQSSFNRRLRRELRRHLGDDAALPFVESAEAIVREIRDARKSIAA
jgi:tetratricopeptide (TPR) repeat protein